MAYFLLWPGPADLAMRELTALGFQVSHSTAGLHHVLTFHAVSGLKDTHQATFLSAILAVIHPRGGVYGGWRSRSLRSILGQAPAAGIEFDAEEY